MGKSAVKDTRYNGWPVSGTALDAIKICAALFMLIDHSALALFGEKFFLARMAGRAAFPLFCYAVAAAILRRDEKKSLDGYLVWLLIFGVVSQPFYNFALDQSHANVFFSLAAGGVIAAHIEKISWRLRHCVFLFAALNVAFANGWDFGVPGVMLPAVLLLVMRGEKQAWPWLLLLLFGINYSSENVNLHDFSKMWFGYTILFFFASVVPYFVIRLCADMDERGRLLSKFFLYYFYPGHLFVLSFLKIFGVPDLL